MAVISVISWWLSQLYHCGYLSYIMAVISVISLRLSQLYHGGYLSYIMAVISVISWQLYHGGYLSYIMAVISGGNISSSMKNVQHLQIVSTPDNH